jgi:hypothetical protein
MAIPGSFAVIGLLLLALHLARPGLLRRLVQADVGLLVRFVPWVALDVHDEESRYQRAYRQCVVITVAGLTLLNGALFVQSYISPF